MSSQPSNHRARLSLRLHPSLRPESPGEGTGARRRLILRAKAPSIKNPAFGTTAESGPDHLVCRVAPDLGVLPFNRPRTGGGQRLSLP
jgi:hypothetical protein